MGVVARDTQVMSRHDDEIEFLELLDELDPVWPRRDRDEEEDG